MEEVFVYKNILQTYDIKNVGKVSRNNCIFNHFNIETLKLLVS